MLSTEVENNLIQVKPGGIDNTGVHHRLNFGRVAIVHDSLPFIGGAERVLESVLELLPDAPIYTLLYNRPAFQSSMIGKRRVVTSFIDKLPFAREHHRAFLPLYPLAVEQFDLSQFDLVISLSYAVAHGVLTHPDQLHIAYIHSPLRYAWHSARYVSGGLGSKYPFKAWIAGLVLHYLRIWDRSAADRVDRFLAVSEYTAEHIWRYYRRRAEVIYPPVDISRFHPATTRENYYLTVSRLTGHKQVSLIVEAFSRLKKPLLIVGDGAEYHRLRKIAGSNIRFVKWVSDQTLADLYSRARGLVHAAEEDFGIVLVEAQAAGCPVIAFGKGGAVETVIPNRTGILYPDQSAESLIQAIGKFETTYLEFNLEDLTQSAVRFSKETFQAQLSRKIEFELQ